LISLFVSPAAASLPALSQALCGCTIDCTAVTVTAPIACALQQDIDVPLTQHSAASKGPQYFDAMYLLAPFGAEALSTNASNCTGWDLSLVSGYPGPAAELVSRVPFSTACEADFSGFDLQAPQVNLSVVVAVRDTPESGIRFVTSAQGASYNGSLYANLTLELRPLMPVVPCDCPAATAATVLFLGSHAGRPQCDLAQSVVLGAPFPDALASCFDDDLSTPTLVTYRVNVTDTPCRVPGLPVVAAPLSVVAPHPAPPAPTLQVTRVGYDGAHDATRCGADSPSGFVRPHADVLVSPTSAQVVVQSFSDWFPPNYVTLAVVGNNTWRVTSNACVSTTPDCEVRQDFVGFSVVEQGFAVSASLPQTVGQGLVVDQAVTCPPRTVCATVPNVAVVPFGSVFASLQLPVDLGAFARVDVEFSGPTPPYSQLAIDSVLVTAQDAGGMTRVYEFAQSYKAAAMHNPLLPEFNDSLFCRSAATGGLFFNENSNMWVLSSLPAINGTLCAFAGDPNRDRFMFTPSDFPFGILNPAATSWRFQVRAVVRAQGALQGCAYADFSIGLPLPPAAGLLTVPAVVTGLAVGLSAGTLAGVGILIMVTGAALRAALGTAAAAASARPPTTVQGRLHRMMTRGQNPRLTR
jgi:hypothetical protein